MNQEKALKVFLPYLFKDKFNFKCEGKAYFFPS